MINKKKVIIALLVCLLLLTEVSGFWANFLKPFVSDLFSEPRKFFSNRQLLKYGIQDYPVGYKNLYTNLVTLITLNPSISGNRLLQASMKLIIPFYTLAIVVIGFYLLLYSGSPAGRAQAKSMLGKLVIGLVIISISPQLLNLGLSLSQSLTYHILDSVGVEVIIGMMKEYISDYSGLYLFVGQLNSSFGFIFPFLWLMYFVWGAFAMIALRYIILTLWIGLFPLTVFFYSFEVTKTLGRNMMEQTILWTVLQAFNASVIVGVVIAQDPGTSTVPWSKSMFVISHFANLMVFVGLAILILAPLMMTRLFRNFLPG